MNSNFSDFKKDHSIEFRNDEGELQEFEVSAGWYLNPFNQEMYDDLDLYFQELELMVMKASEEDDELEGEMFNWIRWKCPYLKFLNSRITDADVDYKRSYIERLYSFETIDGRYWGFSMTESESEFVETGIDAVGFLKEVKTVVLDF